MTERRIETRIDIMAPPKIVWAVLTDFAAMPSWNPFITSIAGDLAPGRRLAVEVAPPGKSRARFKPTILAVRLERELRWRGRVLLPGLFDGEHYFLLEPIGDRATRFTHGERFTGILVGLLGKTLRATVEGFDAMNRALKARAELKQSAA